MPKALISNRIYLDNPGVDLTKSIIKELSYKIYLNTGSKEFQSVENIKNYKILTKGIISIPQSRLDLIPDSYEIIDKRLVVPVPFPDPVFKLHEEQQVIYDQIHDTCILNALPGWGKSFVGLYIARKFGQKTLIVTHTAALRDQWTESVKALFGMEAGVIGGGKFYFDDYAVTIANTQTLVKHADKLAKVFGTVIVDEAHHVPSSTFTNIIDCMHARFRVGLSGTLNRKDGKHILFKDYFGTHVLKPPQSNTLLPSVKLVNTNITLAPGKSWADKITELTQNKDYQNLVAALAKVQIAKGHSVLVIADRVEFLETIAKLIGDDCVVITGDIGDRALVKEQILSGEKKCVAGSRQIFSEGISIDRLSSVILTIPINNNESLLKQIIGRIQRTFPGKPSPEVLDMQFSGWAERRQNTSRLGVYLSEGWVVERL